MNTMLSPDFMDGDRTNELVEFIMREPIVAAKVLATVNSPFYGLQSPIGSVGHAVTFLGLNTVRNVAVQMLAKESFKTDNPSLQKICDGIWNAGMIASELCFRLAQKLGMPDQGTLSTQTLLSFFGDFAILLVRPAQSGTNNWQAGLLARTDCEQRETGVNSCIVGSLLMQEWGLPPGIVEGVGEVAGVLVTPPAAQSPQRAASLALRYAAARIGERVAFGGLRDLDAFDFRTDASPEYYFLNQYFALPALARFHEHLHSPEIRGTVRRLVAKVPEPAFDH
jgi:HD-like signal output (HDOD) protein